MVSRVLLLFCVSIALVSIAYASGSRDDDTPKQLRDRIRCKVLLRRAKKNLKCALLRISLPRRLSRARKCRYNGLSFSDYRETRVICKERSESLTRVRAARKKCRMAGISVRTKMSKDDEEEEEEDEEVDVSGIKCSDYEDLLRARKRAVRACDKIGWTGGNARSRKCEMIKELKWKLTELPPWCGEDGVEEARRDLDRVKRKCKGAAGEVEPKPSNKPRSRR